MADFGKQCMTTRIQALTGFVSAGRVGFPVDYLAQCGVSCAGRHTCSQWAECARQHTRIQAQLGA